MKGLELIMTMDNKIYEGIEFTNISSDYTMWCTCHLKNLISVYNLKETENFKIINVSNIGYIGKHINHLNRFLAECCGILFPMLNNLKSDVIGFCSYNRLFNEVDTNRILKENSIQYYEKTKITDHIQLYKYLPNIKYLNILNYSVIFNLIKNEWYKDIIEFYEKYYPDILEYETNIHSFFYTGCSFVCTWDMYQEISTMILLFIDFIDQKYNLKYNELAWYLHIYNNYILFNQINHTNEKYVNPDFDEYYVNDHDPYKDYIRKFSEGTKIWKIYAYIIEYLISSYINYYNNKFKITKKDEA